MMTETEWAWALLHVRFIVQGIAGPDSAEKQARAYEVFAQEYPAWHDDCQRQIRRVGYVREGM